MNRNVPLETRVRPAKIGELREVSRLFVTVLKSLPYYNSLAKKSEAEKYTPEKLAQKISEDPFSVQVALDTKGKIIGFLFTHFDDYTIWLEWFGVKSSYRGHGVGMTLLKALFRTTPERRAHKVWCDCRVSNTPSHKLLHKAGFKKIAEIKDHWYRQDFILWEYFV